LGRGPAGTAMSGGGREGDGYKKDGQSEEGRKGGNKNCLRERVKTEGGMEREGRDRGGAGWAYGPRQAAVRQTARARRRCAQPVACPPRARTACTSPPPPPLPQAFRPLRSNPSILNPQPIASQSAAAAASRSRLVLLGGEVLAHYGVARQVNTPVTASQIRQVNTPVCQ
jgi:hypothetical protein